MHAFFNESINYYFTEKNNTAKYKIKIIKVVYVNNFPMI